MRRGGSRPAWRRSAPRNPRNGRPARRLGPRRPKMASSSTRATAADIRDARWHAENEEIHDEVPSPGIAEVILPTIRGKLGGPTLSVLSCWSDWHGCSLAAVLWRGLRGHAGDRLSQHVHRHGRALQFRSTEADNWNSKSPAGFLVSKSHSTNA